MPIVPDKKITEPYVQLKARLPKRIYDEVESYCQWRDDISKSYFLEHVIAYAFKHDKDWQAHKNGHVPVSVESQQTPFESMLDSKGVLDE